MIEPKPPLRMQGPEWESWLHHPETQRFLSMLKDSAYDSTVSWGNGNYTSDNPHLHLMNEAEARGSVQALLRLIEQIEDIEPQPEENQDGNTDGRGSEDREDGEGPESGDASPFRR